MFLGFTVQKSNILTILELRNTIYATSLELNHLSLAFLFSSQLEMFGSLRQRGQQGARPWRRRGQRARRGRRLRWRGRQVLRSTGSRQRSRRREQGGQRLQQQRERPWQRPRQRCRRAPRRRWGRPPAGRRREPRRQREPGTSCWIVCTTLVFKTNSTSAVSA